MLTLIPIATLLGITIFGGALFLCKRGQGKASQRYPGKRNQFGFSKLRPFMEMEMERARRLGYSLGVIVISDPVSMSPGDESESEQTTKARNNHDQISGIVDLIHGTTLLSDTLRMIDMAAYDEERRFVVIMLPGSDHSHAMRTAVRINNALAQNFGLRVQTGCSEFSGDGLLLDDLIMSAYGRLGYMHNVIPMHNNNRTEKNATL